MTEQLPPQSDEMPNQEDDALNISETLQTEPIDLREVQDLSLEELLRAFFKEPRAVWTAFREILRSDSYGSRMIAVPLANDEDSPVSFFEVLGRFLSHRLVIRLLLYLLAFAVVLFGNIILSAEINSNRNPDRELVAGLPFLLLGFLIWLSAELFANWNSLSNWWAGRREPKPKPEVSISGDTSGIISHELPFYMRIPSERLILALVAMILTVWSWFNSTQNDFAIRLPFSDANYGGAEIAIFMWILSVFLWGLTFAPLDFDPLQWANRWGERLSHFRWRSHSLVIIAFVLIMAFAWHFRFHDLDTIPLEMTDDHVEKILDSGLVNNGYRPIFLANNGGREPLQMYLIALASHLPNLGINFYTIKWVAGIESLLTIPILFWMGYELMEGASRRKRLLTGLILAALVAVSYWHVAITRQGLRIPLTPLVVGLEIIYLTRAIRRNSRADFIKAGMVLGFGLYTYQAIRMLPVAIVVAVLVAIIFKAKTVQERLKYLLNLTVLVGIAFVAFVPMFHYSVEYPDLFWRRTAGRLLGDDIIQETLADGSLIYRNASLDERMNAFMSNVPIISSNIRNVLLMFNWQGDVATISGVSNRPSMDIWSAALLIVGLAAWLAYSIQRKDTMLGLVPLILFIMLLPSALAIAIPGENPSHTRSSGAIPLVYFLAALPLGIVMDLLLENFKKWRGRFIATILTAVILLGSFNANSYLYFVIYPERYDAAFHPYSDAGDYLEGFVLTDGTYGNAFLIGAEHWWSHRAVGLEGGLEEFWTNGVYPRTNIPLAFESAANRTDIFHLNPNVDMIFFYSPNDDETEAYLQELFPDGTATEHLTHKANETFMVYRVPALGTDGLATWIELHSNN